MSSSDYVAKNRAVWTRSNRKYTDAAAQDAWARDTIEWGMFGVPEAEIQALGDVAGKDIVELGCGTAYFSAWLAKRGARPIGVDITPAQLDTARRMQAEFGLEFPLLEANAEDVPLPDASFDLVLSEYGASIWCDPYKWIPEAARLLRSAGELVFLRNSTLVILCSPDTGMVVEQLVRPQFGMHRFEWPEEEGGGVEYHLAHGDWIRVLRSNGFDVVDLIELQAPPNATTHAFYDFVGADWARKWPAEELWRARKRG